MAGPRGVPRGPVFCNGPVTQATRFLIEATIRGDMEDTVATTTTRNPLVYVAAGVGLFVGLLIVIAVASGPARPAPKVIDGTFRLTENALPGLGGCTGMGPYEDIAQGTAVSVLNEAGAVVGSTGLEYSYYDTTKGGSAVCYFTFTVSGVSGAYSVRVGNHTPERIYGDTVALESHLS